MIEVFDSDKFNQLKFYKEMLMCKRENTSLTIIWLNEQFPDIHYRI